MTLGLLCCAVALELAAAHLATSSHRLAEAVAGCSAPQRGLSILLQSVSVMDAAASSLAKTLDLNTADAAAPQPHRLDTVPRDVQLCILCRCGTADLAAVAVTCSRLRAVAQTDELWRSAAEKAFAWKPTLAHTMRTAVARAHWLERSHEAAWALGCSSWRPAAQPLRSTAAEQQSVNGTEWLLTRAGTRLRESFMAY